MSIYVHVLLQEDLTVMLYLYDLYKVSIICVYVEKSHCQTLKPTLFKAKKRCLSNLNVEYIGSCEDDVPEVSHNLFEEEDELDGPSESQQDIALMYWRLETLNNYHLNN